MTPSPEKKKILKKFNKKMLGSNVERTVEKYGQSQSQSQTYGRERNGSEYDRGEYGDEEEKGQGYEDEVDDDEQEQEQEEGEEEGDSEEEEEGEEEDRDDEGEESSDDDCSIGALNLSNHDINDDDEVLQSVPDYHTPETKNKNKKQNSNSNPNSNTSKITPTNNATKSHPKNTKMNVKVSSPFLTGRPVTPSPEKKTFLQQNLSNKITAKSAYKMAKLPIKNRRLEKDKEKEKDKNDYTRTPDKVKNTFAAGVSGMGMGIGAGMGGGRSGGECRFMGSVRDEEMKEITAQIRTLSAELKYFEELTGKRCIFETAVSDG